MEDIINQGGEAFLLVFIVGGAIFMMLWLFCQNPKRFLKWVLKDIVKQFVNQARDEDADRDERKPGAADSDK